MRSSLARRSIPCFSGIRTLRAATFTFRMSRSPTLRWMTRGHGRKPSGRVVGLLEAGRFRSSLHQGWLTPLARRVCDLGASCRLSLKYTKLPALQIKLSEVMHCQILVSKSGDPGQSTVLSIGTRTINYIKESS
jgi:hypothetical protein